MKKVILSLLLVASAAVAEPSADYMCQYVDTDNGREYVTTVVKFRDLPMDKSLSIEINGVEMVSSQHVGNPNGLTYSADQKATFNSNVGKIIIPLTEENCSVLIYPESRDM